MTTLPVQLIRQHLTDFAIKPAWVRSGSVWKSPSPTAPPHPLQGIKSCLINPKRHGPTPKAVCPGNIFKQWPGLYEAQRSPRTKWSHLRRTLLIEIKLQRTQGQNCCCWKQVSSIKTGTWCFEWTEVKISGPGNSPINEVVIVVDWRGEGSVGDKEALWVYFSLLRSICFCCDLFSI